MDRIPLDLGKVLEGSECNQPHNLSGRTLPECSQYWTVVSLMSLYIWTPFVHRNKQAFTFLLLLPLFGFSSPVKPWKAYSFGTENHSSTAEEAESYLFAARNICGKGWETIYEFVKQWLQKQWCWDLDNNLVFSQFISHSEFSLTLDRSL